MGEDQAGDELNRLRKMTSEQIEAAAERQIGLVQNELDAQTEANSNLQDEIDEVNGNILRLETENHRLETMLKKARSGVLINLLEDRVTNLTNEMEEANDVILKLNTEIRRLQDKTIAKRIESDNKIQALENEIHRLERADMDSRTQVLRTERIKSLESDKLVARAHVRDIIDHAKEALTVLRKSK